MAEPIQAPETNPESFLDFTSRRKNELSVGQRVAAMQSPEARIASTKAQRTIPGQSRRDALFKNVSTTSVSAPEGREDPVGQVDESRNFAVTESTPKMKAAMQGFDVDVPEPQEFDFSSFDDEAFDFSDIELEGPGGLVKNVVGAFKDAPSDLAEGFSELAGDLKERAMKTWDAFKGANDGELKLSSFTTPLGQGLGAVSDIIGHVVMTGGKLLLSDDQEKAVGRLFGTGAKKLLERKDENGMSLGDAISIVSERFDGLEDETKRNLENAGAVAMFVTDLLGGVGAKKVTKEVAEEIAQRATKKAVKESVEGVINIPKELPQSVSIGTVGDDVAGDISKAIIPKRNAKLESQTLKRQGFEDPTLFQKLFGGKRGIKPSQELIDDGVVISEIIGTPDTKNIQSFTKQLDDAGSSIREELRPRLKSETFSESASDEILSIGSEIEKDVLNAFSSTTKDEKVFKKFVDSFLNAKNLDDLWSARIEWDKWVPKNVKQAGDLSSADLLARHDVWIQNRQKINDLIEKLSPDDVEFKTKLNQMRALINARENVSTKATEFAKIKGLVPQWLKVSGATTATLGGGALLLR